MRNISKIITSSLILSTCLFANMDEDLLKFEKQRFSSNPAVKIESVKINTKKAMPLNGWNGYIIDINAKVKGKTIKAKDIVFFDGRFIAPELIDTKTKKSLKDMMSPDLSAKYYDKAKLIAGNHNTKNKLVIFSDPLCPYCMDFVPDVIRYVKKHKKDLALYYYHFPLTRIHPASNPLSALMALGREKGIEDIELKVYETDWDEYFKASETNKQVILKAFNKKFKTNFTQKNLDKEMAKIKKDMALGEDVMVQGTPTLYVNGKKDNSKKEYLKLVK